MFNEDVEDEVVEEDPFELLKKLRFEYMSVSVFVLLNASVFSLFVSASSPALVKVLVNGNALLPGVFVQIFDDILITGVFMDLLDDFLDSIFSILGHLEPNLRGSSSTSATLASESQQVYVILAPSLLDGLPIRVLCGLFYSNFFDFLALFVPDLLGSNLLFLLLPVTCREDGR